MKCPGICFLHFLPAVFLMQSGVAQAAGGNAIDRLNFGNNSSESVHNYAPGVAAGGTGVSNQTYWLPAVNSQVVFTMGCDPNRQTYLTVKFWGNDDSCQLDLDNAPAQYPAIERDQGPTAIFPNRFYYHTIPIPLSSTSNRTSVEITLNVGSATKRIYSAFTHTAPCFVPDSTDPTGIAPARTGQATLTTLTTNAAVALMQSVRSGIFPSYYNTMLNRQVLPGTAGAPPECIGLDLWTAVSGYASTNTPDAWRNKIANQLAGPGYTAFPDELLGVLCTSFILPPFTNTSGSVVAGLDHYHDTNLIARIIYALDGATYMQSSEGGMPQQGGDWCGITSTPRTNSDYALGSTNRQLIVHGGGDLQGVDTYALGWTIINILNDPVGAPVFSNYLAQSYNADLNGVLMQLATAYERMLYNYCNFFPTHEGGTETQNLFQMLSMYSSWVALQKLQQIFPNAAYASPANGLTYARMVMGLIPDTLRGVNPSPLTIPNYGHTAKGLGEAHGVLSTGFDGGGYGQIIPWLAPRIAQLAAWDTTISTTDLSNIVASAHTTVDGFDQFLYPQDNATMDANRNLTANTYRFAEERFITYRDPKNPQENSGAFNFNAQFPASDPAGPMTNAFARRSAYLFTQYGLTPITGSSAGNGATGGALNYLRDLPAYERTVRGLINVAPATIAPLPGEPGQPDYAWADMQAGAVAFYNNGERFFMNANWRNYEFNNGFTSLVPSQHARVHYTTTNIERAAMIRLPFDNTTVQTDGNLSSTSLLSPYAVRFGDYLIVLNNSSNVTYNAKLPVGVGQAKDLITGNYTNLGSTVPVAPGQSAIFWLAASNTLASGPGAPTVATSAAASTNLIYGTTVNLSVLGADDGGEVNLTYTWALAGNPPNPVAVSANGNNAAKNTTATFAAAGTYSFVVIIKDAGGLMTNSAVTITVNQTVSSLIISPVSALVLSGQSQQFAATAADQFGIPMQSALPFSWSVFSGVGSVNSSGLYTAPTGSGGSATVRVTSGAFNANAAVTVAGPVGVFTGSLAIGSPSLVGSASYNSNTTVYSLSIAGGDVWDTSDTFRFACVPLAGDFTITARVASQPNTHQWVKAGVMIRNTLDANSANAFMFVTPQNGANFQWRSSAGATTGQTRTNGFVAPFWVRLTRSGSSFTSFYSTNGTTWFPLGLAQTIAMNNSVYVGLALSNPNTGSLNTSTFDNVSIADSLTIPTGVSALAGDGQVSVGWTGSTSATSYNLKRSTANGGPYTLIGSPATIGFTDTGVANGTTYYYVVSALNHLRETTNSAQASATPGAVPVATTRGNLIVNLQSADLAGGTLSAWTNRTSYSNSVGNFSANGAGALVVTSLTYSGVNVSALYVNNSATRALISALNVPAEIAANGSMSVEAWVYGLGFLSAQSGVLGYGTNNPNNSDRQFLAYGINSGNNYKAFAGQFNDMSYAVTNVFTLNAWHLISWTYNGTNRLLTVYVDGVFNASQTMNTMLTPQVPMGVGGVWRAGGIIEAFPGCLGAMRVQSGLLTANDIAGNYTAGLLAAASPSKPAGLTAAPGDSQVMLNWNAATNATGYNVKRSAVSGGPYSIVATNMPGLTFTNTGLSNGTRYYFVVSASNLAGESGNSVEVSAQPVTIAPPQLGSSLNGSQLQLTWPSDHIGWRLEAQTNSSDVGLATNWSTVSGSTSTNEMFVPINAANGSVFFRLVYP
jgi:regulation of enolase protein 1 (concanavalin A-like superfamily)